MLRLLLEHRATVASASTGKWHNASTVVDENMSTFVQFLEIDEEVVEIAATEEKKKKKNKNKNKNKNKKQEQGPTGR